MPRSTTQLPAMIACLAGIFCVRGVTASEGVGDRTPVEGLWSGSWGGGGGADRVVYQPVIAQMIVKGDQVELTGFPQVNALKGTVRFNTDTSRMTIIPTEKAT